jgi:hypothetical protein
MIAVAHSISILREMATVDALKDAGYGGSTIAILESAAAMWHFP